MKIGINPMVDCVFKALLGSEENKNLLIHFLNAVLGLEGAARIVTVAILNPFNERTFRGDKQTVVDVKARDGQGRLYQVEVQRLREPHLGPRMRYTFSRMNTGQMTAGEDFGGLKPVVSIWLLGERLFPGLPDMAHHLQLSDARTGAYIEAESGIHILELPKMPRGAPVGEVERWLSLFRDGEALDPEDIPPHLRTAEMQQAIKTLMTFQEREERRDLYEDRLYAHLVENTRRRAEEEAFAREARAQANAKRAKAEAAQAQAEAAQAQAELAVAQETLAEGRAEIERAHAESAALRREAEAARALRARLIALGEDPDAL